MGALFLPEAYIYFPYFGVSFTAVLLAIVKEQQDKKSEFESQHGKIGQNGDIGTITSSPIVGLIRQLEMEGKEHLDLAVEFC